MNLRSTALASRELAYFLLLSPEEQEQAIRKMAISDMGDYAIATATRLSVEQVRRVLAGEDAGARIA